MTMTAQSMSQAWLDVLAERYRQVDVEGWTPSHDNEHPGGDLAAAASAYSLYASDELNPKSLGDCEYDQVAPFMWPFHIKWWKPTTPRRALVKSAALILAEIERLDRTAAPQP